MKKCGICERDLKGKDDAVYSQTTGAWYCPVGTWDACRKRGDKLLDKLDAKKAA